MQIKIGTPSGTFKSYDLLEDSTIQDLVTMYTDDTGVTIDGMELRVDGDLITNRNVPIYGTMVILSKQTKSSNDFDGELTGTGTVVEEAPIKKKDLFTKEYCENTAPEDIAKALIDWAFEQKGKNKYLQAAKHVVLGNPAPITMGSVTYDTVLTNGEIGVHITTVELVQPPFPAIIFKALENETSAELITRWNKAVTK